MRRCDLNEKRWQLYVKFESRRNIHVIETSIWMNSLSSIVLQKRWSAITLPNPCKFRNLIMNLQDDTHEHFASQECVGESLSLSLLYMHDDYVFVYSNAGLQLYYYLGLSIHSIIIHDYIYDYMIPLFLKILFKASVRFPLRSHLRIFTSFSHFYWII